MNLGYAVTDKYRRFTKDLFHAYNSGENIENISLNPVLPMVRAIF